MKNPEHLGRLVLLLIRRCLNLCNEKKAALPEGRLKPASIVARPVRAIRITIGGWGLAKNGKKSQISEKKSQIVSRLKSSVFCNDHGIFRAHEINTSLLTICGPFHLIARKFGRGLSSPKTLVRNYLQVLFATRSQKKVPSQLDMGRSLYTVFTLVSKASFSLNKMGVYFLVYRAIVGLFCLCCSNCW